MTKKTELLQVSRWMRLIYRLSIRTVIFANKCIDGRRSPRVDPEQINKLMLHSGGSALNQKTLYRSCPIATGDPKVHVLPLESMLL